MTEETAKWVPEVRIKFLRRQLKSSKYRKNIIASTTPLLKLIMAMVKEQRPYQMRSETVDQMRALEQKVTQRKEERLGIHPEGAGPFGKKHKHAA
jgi:type VI protein secretion system component VasF